MNDVTRTSKAMSSCPFCGRALPRTVIDYQGGEHFYLECQRCFARGPRTVSSEEKASELWDLRAAHEPRADLPTPINHELWRHMHDEHGLTLLQSELDEILRHAQPPPADDLRAALVKAVEVIQTWHNMGVPRREQSDMWDIYWRKAPEMELIRSALTKEVSRDLCDYGYAPGGYIIKCMHCKEQVWECDKRAAACKPCAEKRMRAALGEGNDQ